MRYRDLKDREFFPEILIELRLCAKPWKLNDDEKQGKVISTLWLTVEEINAW